MGPYRIVKPLGRGGMGAVYIASRDDDEYEREVAIKLIRRGLDGPDARRRFRQERQILASLQHPNITQLYDGGTTAAGQPYLVMEPVSGLPLLEHCDRHRLPVEMRLSLFRQVCEAVSYAHSRLVIHRDLKPSNILVTEDGTPKLLDFGIAKLLEAEGHSELTESGQSPRTPAYASPEQVQGENVTTASDVYALGYLLYQLLCGRRPYRLESKRTMELESAILQQIPERPSAALFRAREETSPREIADARDTAPKALARRLSGDLDLIVLKALKKSPGERYGSPQELSEDIRRHLESLPVGAQADSWLYRSSRFLRRNRFGTALISLLVLSSVVFGLLMARQVEETERERDTAEAVTSFMTGLFEEAQADRSGGEVSARELLEAGAERVQDELADEPRVRSEVHYLLGRIYNSLGLFVKGEGHLRSSQDEVGVELPAARLGQSYVELGWSLTQQARFAEASSALGRALEICPAETEPTCRVTALTQLGSLQQDQGELEAAKATLRETIAVLEGVDSPSLLSQAKVYHSQGMIDLELGRFDEAQEAFERSLELETRYWGPESPELANVISNIAITHLYRGKHWEAIELWRRAVDLLEPVAGRVHPRIADMLTNMGGAYESEGEHSKAEAHYAEALEIKRETLGADNPGLVGPALNLGGLRTALGRYDAALPVLED
ncbi:MAG: serine/threonine-protein kinase, partial [Acidobacteriota bacterium]